MYNHKILRNFFVDYSLIPLVMFFFSWAVVFLPPFKLVLSELISFFIVIIYDKWISVVLYSLSKTLTRMYNHKILRNFLELIPSYLVNKFFSQILFF